MRDDDRPTLGSLVRERLAVPWKKAKALCRDGHVRVGGTVERDPARRVSADARIDIGAGSPRVEEIPLPWVDAHVVVADKPAGLLTVPWEDERDTLVQRVHAQLRQRAGHFVPPPRVVSRLDKDTSGLVVFARTRLAERHLKDLWRGHDVERVYLALCEGRVHDERIETMLVADRGDGRRGSARPGRVPAGAKKAVTEVRTLACVPSDAAAWDLGPAPRSESGPRGESGSRGESGPRGESRPRTVFAPRSVSLVACRLHTGRQHQIRIHLAEAGHALLGEAVYGERGRARWRLGTRPLLHAATLGFLHPTADPGAAWHRFVAEPPADFMAALKALGIPADAWTAVR